ncbi:MAG: hypothetical protein ACI9GH_000405 [Candidatus Paceibacteria bacterium]|jgi:hypothetical protein
MIFSKFKKENRLMAWIILVSLIFISLGIVFLNNDVNLVDTVSEPLTLGEVEWVKYENKEYGFELEYPNHWRIHVEDDDLSPKINFYPFQNNIELPLSHFTNATQFSIYPKGIPSEGLIGENVEVGLNINEEVDVVREYVLADKDKWATMITFKDVPESWKPWGFIWAGVAIEDLEYSCRQGFNIVSAELCNTFEGDELLRDGNTDNDLLEIERKIINSFKFIK